MSINIFFKIKEATFTIESDIKKHLQSDLITEFLRTQIGAGVDNTPRNEKDIYNITLKWNPDYDSFEILSDTGNLGLRDGILMHVASKLME